MKQKTKMVYINVTSTYTPKNKLEEHALNELTRLNYLLVGSLPEAKEEINIAIDRAKKECVTAKRCKPLHVQKWSISGNATAVRVNDVIQLALYPVFEKSVNS